MVELALALLDGVEARETSDREGCSSPQTDMGAPDGTPYVARG